MEMTDLQGVVPALLAPPQPAEPEVVARIALDGGLTAEWALVLDSMELPCRVDEVPGGWALVVRPADLDAAQATLSAYESENPEIVAPVTVPEAPGGAWAGAVLGLALLGFSRLPEPWTSKGVADAAAILHGDLGRAATALTLHADFNHLLGNVIASILFVGAVGRWLGPGVAIGLVLLAGSAGNVANAVMLGAGHRSLGASTATFGALGILGALQFVRTWRSSMGKRAWIALAASLGLLAMLGTAGAHTDVSAHVFGLVVGAGLGLAVASRRDPRPPALGWQILGACASAALLATSWWSVL